MRLYILLTSLVSICFSETIPFNYPLNEHAIERANPKPLILFHGYGANYQIADSIQHLKCLDQTLISFNFPDCDRLLKGHIWNDQRALTGILYIKKTCSR